VNEAQHFTDRRKKQPRSRAEIVIAVAAVLGVLVSVLTGIRAFYVNEYRIDILEVTVRETRTDIKEAKTAVVELDRSVQRLIGAADKHGWTKH
jgi:cell division protein FtsL